MDLAKRLVALVLLALCGFNAHASFPATESTRYSCGGQPGHGGWHATTTAAVAAWVATYNPGAVGPPYGWSGGNCTAILQWNGATANTLAYSQPVRTCPANSTLSGTVCNCNSGYVENGASCVVQQTPEEQHCASINGSPVKASWTTTNPSLSTRTICMSNAGYSCTATVEGDICGSTGPNGPYLCHGSGVSGASGAGTTCTPSPEPDAPPPVGTPDTNWPDAPPPGTCPGTINGVSVNVPCSNTNTSNTKTEQADDGAGNVTSKSETKNTTCNAAGSCTTTVTTTTTVNGGAPTTSTKTTTEGKGQFCAGNPGSKECGDGDGSSFGGSCQASFVCTGDAVQCATAKAVNDQLCEFKEAFEVGDDAKALANRVMEGTEVPDPKANAELVNLGAFDQSNPWGTACPTDIAVTVWGRSTVIPLGRHCETLRLLGNLAVAMSLIVATVFVIRGGS